MKTKIQSIIVATIVVVIGYILSHPIFFHTCGNTYQFNDYTGCLDSSIKEIGFPLFDFSVWVLLSVALMAFLSEKIFKSWLRFAMWAIPFLVLFIATTTVSGSRMGINFFPFYRDDAARLAGGVFAAASLVLIIWKWFAARGESVKI